jgi:hypothetical protein
MFEWKEKDFKAVIGRINTLYSQIMSFDNKAWPLFLQSRHDLAGHQIGGEIVRRGDRFARLAPARELGCDETSTAAADEALRVIARAGQPKEQSRLVLGALPYPCRWISRLEKDINVRL